MKTNQSQSLPVIETMAGALEITLPGISLFEARHRYDPMSEAFKFLMTKVLETVYSVFRTRKPISYLETSFRSFSQ